MDCGSDIVVQIKCPLNGHYPIFHQTSTGKLKMSAPDKLKRALTAGESFGDKASSSQPDKQKQCQPHNNRWTHAHTDGRHRKECKRPAPYTTFRQAQRIHNREVNAILLAEQRQCTTVAATFPPTLYRNSRQSNASCAETAPSNTAHSQNEEKSLTTDHRRQINR